MFFNYKKKDDIRVWLLIIILATITIILDPLLKQRSLNSTLKEFIL